MTVVAGFKLPLFALLCAGCANIGADRHTFEGTEWQATAIDGEATPRAENYRVQFREGRLGGRLGCNSFSGVYRVRAGTTLIVGPVGATEMACEGPGMDFERRGFEVLQQPMRLDWAGSNRVTLSNHAGSIALELMP
jgi:heat shock protein HslJ